MSNVNACGIYQIRNLVNGKIYIGSASVSFRKRWYEHRRLLKKNEHCNTLLQRAFNKYGESSFTFDVVQECEPEDVLIWEQFWIDNLSPEYNLCPFAGNTRGLACSDETKIKIGNANRGKIHPPRSLEYREKISVRNKGKILSEETRQKVSESQKKRLSNPEAREHLRSLNLGKKLSEETIAKFKATRNTPEYKIKISKALKGKVKVSEAHRQKLREIHSGDNNPSKRPEVKEKKRLTRLANLAKKSGEANSETNKTESSDATRESIGDTVFVK